MATGMTISVMCEYYICLVKLSVFYCFLSVFDYHYWRIKMVIIVLA